MLFGLSMGLMVAIMAYLRAPAAVGPLGQSVAARVQPAAAQAAAAAPAATNPPATRETARTSRAPAERPPPAENRFEFYEILPQFEVVIPDEPAARPAASSAATQPRPRAAETPGSFLLQAGSFSAAADADRMKANLALLGFESHVQRVQIDDGVFNRVRIGPLGDMDAAKRTQRQLRDAGIDTLLMQVPK